MSGALSPGAAHRRCARRGRLVAELGAVLDPDVWGKSFDDAMTAWAEIAQRGAATRRGRRPSLRPADQGGRRPPCALQGRRGQGHRPAALIGRVSGRQRVGRAAAEAGRSPRASRSAYGSPPSSRKATSTPTTASARTTPAGLTEVTQALAAFQADIEARGLGDRVLDLRLVRVRAPRRGRASRPAPTTAPAASRS